MATYPLETFTDYARKSSTVHGAKTHYFVLLFGPTLFYTNSLAARGAKSDFQMYVGFLSHFVLFIFFYMKGKIYYSVCFVLFLTCFQLCNHLKEKFRSKSAKHQKLFHRNSNVYCTKACYGYSFLRALHCV